MRIEHDGVDSGPPYKQGFVARSTQQTAVDQGDRVNGAANLNGEQVMAGYDWTNAALTVRESAPASQRVTHAVLINETNITSGTTDYGYIDLQYDKELILQIGIGSATDTCTVTIEGSVWDDGTPQASCSYLDITQYGMDNMCGAAAASYTASTVLKLKQGCPCRYIRVKYMTAGGNNDADLRVDVRNRP